MKFKFKNLIAFTLSEMMIVLLIVSVISAATIPTITQQKQKPYNVGENNSSSTSDIWKYDNFSGIFSALSLSDNAQKVVIGTDTKNYTASQGSFSVDATQPSLVLRKNRNLSTTDDRGQIVFYDRGKKTGSLGLDANFNVMLGYGVMYNQRVYDGQSLASTRIVGIGYYAGASSSNASNVYKKKSIFIGEKAAYNNMGAESVVSIGKYADASSNKLYNTVSVGTCAGSNICMANSSAYAPSFSPEYANVAIGSNAGRLGYAPVTTGNEAHRSNNISVGYYSGYYVYGALGNNGRDLQMENISIGAYSGYRNSYSNTINVGVFAGARISSTHPDYHEIKNSNINIGYYAGANDDKKSFSYGTDIVSSEGQSISIGNYAGFSNFALPRSVMIGSFSGASAQGSIFKNSGKLGDSSIVAVGYYAMYGAQAANTVSIGAYSGFSSKNAKGVMLGIKAGYKGEGSNNIFIGRYAGSESSLSNSIAIGNGAGRYAKGSNNVFIGYGAGIFGVNSVTGSNKYIILPYSSSSFESDTGNKFNSSSTRPQMVIGPGHGLSGSANYFANTKLLLYASKVYARQTTMTLFSSDRRAKENIVKAKYGINEVRNLQPSTYRFKLDATNKLHVGLIAQEVQKYIPEAVEKTAGGKLSIKFDWILFPVANAIKDLDKSITQMNKDLIAQAKQLVSLERHVDKLGNKTRTTLEKQEKMQFKLNDINGKLSKMENK